jgi:hypothetical protein
MLEAKLNYRSGLRIGNITKWLSHEEAIKQHAAKNVGEKSVIEMCQEVH